jgi:hypothetical protein
MPTPYVLSLEQFAAVSALPGPQRYKHFVSRVADWQAVWGLRNKDGWVSAGDDSGKPVLPFWPHPDYATACATGEWADTSPSSIEIHEFIENWLPSMSAVSVLVAVFPTTTLRDVTVPARQLEDQIRDELSQIE